MKRSGKILLEGTIEEFKKHCKGADNREYLLINIKETKKDGTYTIYQLDSNTERMTSISAKGKYGKLSFIPYKEYLTLVAKSAGTFLFVGNGANTILYSTDNGETWSEPLQMVTVNVQKGKSVLWKGEMTPYSDYRLGIGTFSGTATFEAKGNVMSLLFGDNYIGKTSLENKYNALAYLWRYSKIIKAHNLSLPATTLGDSCYYGMFTGCTSLITVPELPATTLTNNCYGYMFNGCTSLKEAPELPATTLVLSCYYYMFYNCISLTKAPKLPATTVASGCYNNMFSGCSSLIQAPELPATTLAYSCYLQMFLGCSSLNYIKMLATDISANSCLYSWVSNVANSGTFVKATSMTTLPTNNTSGIPSGWTVEDFPRDYLKFVAKSLGKFNFSSTTASNKILYSTDNGSTWSTPSQLISINVNIGDLIMWKGEMTPTENGIGSFNKSTAAFDIEGNIMSLLYGDNFEKQTYLKGDSSTFKYLFSKTKVNSVKDLLLPFTTLVESCYESMFQECTELVRAPQLPALTLTEACYKNMFKGCTSLNYIEMMATNISASYCLENWVNNVAETGILIIDENQTEIPIGDSGVPLGWASYSISSYYSLKYLTLVAKNSGTFNFKGTSSNMIQYSTNNGETWSEPSNDVTVNVTKGDIVLWKGEMIPGTSNPNNGIGKFTNSTASFEVKGNAMSLLYGDNFIGLVDLTGKDCAFYYLFLSSNCVNAEALILPATTLANSCYSSMFENCVSLTTPPTLPANTMAEKAYYRMFYGCTSLTTAPLLNATTLGTECYASMFFECSSLKYAPSLPAMTLASKCYDSMFWGCTSLITAPELPATTLATYCYYNMFSGCTSLTLAPELPATTLTDNCYQNMFLNCTSLTTAPLLPATVLKYRCYRSMFANTNVLPDCSNIDFTSVSVVQSGGLQGLFYGTKVTDNDLMDILPINPQTNHYWLPVTSLSSECYDSMFYSCTDLVTAPELPATVLSTKCYYSMFNKCSSLVLAPSLPATILVKLCYYNMFNLCTHLTYIKMLATDISASLCLSNLAYNVAASGTFVKNANAPASLDLYIPSGWTVEDYVEEE